MMVMDWMSEIVSQPQLNVGLYKSWPWSWCLFIAIKSKLRHPPTSVYHDVGEKLSNKTIRMPSVEPQVDKYSVHRLWKPRHALSFGAFLGLTPNRIYTAIKEKHLAWSAEGLRSSKQKCRGTVWEVSGEHCYGELWTEEIVRREGETWCPRRLWEG